jgi:predicted O-methyltransferase YrrM
LDQSFCQHIGERPNVLEIGSFEGNSAVWTIEHLAKHHKGGTITCIDSWASVEELKGVDFVRVKKRFDVNIKLAQTHIKTVDVTVMAEHSQTALPKLLRKKASHFDFIYIDGGHRSDEVLTDLVLSLLLCKPNGIIVCDDYLWSGGTNLLQSPRFGIDSFANVYANQVEQLRHLPIYQVYFKKKSPENDAEAIYGDLRAAKP